MILNAGSPVAVQPKIAETESSMQLAESSKFSSQQVAQLQLTSYSQKSAHGGGMVPSQSQDFTRSAGRGKRAKHRGGNNASALRFSSSFSRKSIRKSSLDGADVQEVTSFAHYVQAFFANLFGCCGGAGAAGDKSTSMRHSMSSSMQSNCLQYSFVAVPNANSGSLASNQTAKNKLANKHEYNSRAKQIRDFRV